MFLFVSFVVVVLLLLLLLNILAYRSSWSRDPDTTNRYLLCPDPWLLNVEVCKANSSSFASTRAIKFDIATKWVNVKPGL